MVSEMAIKNKRRKSIRMSSERGRYTDIHRKMGNANVGMYVELRSLKCCYLTVNVAVVYHNRHWLTDGGERVLSAAVTWNVCDGVAAAAVEIIAQRFDL